MEFTTHVNGSPCPAPTKDNLLVFYMPIKDEIEKIVNRLSNMGYHEVEPENPYWIERNHNRGSGRLENCAYECI